jgi:hypothetical protein
MGIRYNTGIGQVYDKELEKPITKINYSLVTKNLKSPLPRLITHSSKPMQPNTPERGGGGSSLPLKQ